MEKAINKKDILVLLEKIDKSLEGIQRKVKLYCVGGTVLVLSDLRYSSKDVDFIANRQDFRTLSGHIAHLEWKDKIKFDIFPDGAMPNYEYSEYNQHAKKAPFHFKNMEIYYLDNIDLVLTKAIAGRARDYEDINLVAPSPATIPKDELIRRFKTIRPKPKEKEKLKTKFDKFISEFYK